MPVGLVLDIRLTTEVASPVISATTMYVLCCQTSVVSSTERDVLTSVSMAT